MIATLITLPTFIALVVLFIWTAASGLFGDDNANDQNNQNQNMGWDWDMGREELEGVKILLNLGVLAIACGTLFVPIAKSGSGFYDRFNEGVLAASMFMFGNMLFVSFWYSVNFGEGEGENNNNQNGYYGNYVPYYAMDDEQRLLYHQKVVSYTCLALGLAFIAVSACLNSGAHLFPEEEEREGQLAQFHSHLAVQFKVLSEMWNFLSLATFVTFVALFIAACVLAGGEEAERMREEGRIINVIMVFLCMALVTTVMLTWGSEVFTVRRSGSLGTGILYGGTKYFAGLLIVVCLLFANPTFDERQREEGTWVATVATFVCFFFSLIYAVFSSRLREYQVSLIDASSAITVLEPKMGIVNSATGDFVRVGEP